jgi:Polyketide cyclase / dehydrase and lipid transport
MHVSVEAGIPAPAEVAWPVLVDWERQSEWMRDADSVRLTSTARGGVGTVLAVRTRVLGVPLLTERLEVVGWEPPYRVVISHRRAVRGTGEWLLVPAGRGCRLRWTEDVSLPVPVAGELALAIYRPLLRRLMAGSAAAFAQVVAGRADAPG